METTFLPLLALVVWENRILRALRQLSARKLIFIEHGQPEQYGCYRQQLLDELDKCRGCAVFQARVAA